jgi:hypothetical protein
LNGKLVKRPQAKAPLYLREFREALKNGWHGKCKYYRLKDLSAKKSKGG